MHTTWGADHGCFDVGMLQDYSGRQLRHLVHALAPSIVGQDLVKVRTARVLKHVSRVLHEPAPKPSLGNNGVLQALMGKGFSKIHSGCEGGQPDPAAKT